MTDTPPPEGSGGGVQESLLDPAEELALYPSGLVPDPLKLARYVTGVDGTGGWHAVDRELAEHAGTQAAGGLTAAVCGAYSYVSKHGVYDRTATPVSYSPCRACAWTVAVVTGSAEREIRLITPNHRAAAALAAAGADPYLAVRICRAILAQAAAPDAEHDLGHPVTVQLLAQATAHRPVLWLPEDCAEDDRFCQHRPAELDWDAEEWRCEFPDATAGCGACTLHAGPWAGEWEGIPMDECRVTAPCGVLRALSLRYCPPHGCLIPSACCQPAS
jgi:hypothetical protein